MDFTDEQISAKKSEFDELLYDEPQLKEGQTWYLISTRWYERFEDFLGLGHSRGGGAHPGPIQNESILEADGSLKPHTRERIDFIIRSEAFWKLLHETFGGGPAIPRKVITSMWNNKAVETHPFRLQFLKSSDMTTIHTGLFSKAAKIKVVRDEMCKRMGLSVDDVRMWDYHNDQKLKILEDPLCTLAEERILDGQKLLFEERLPDGKWPKLATKRDRDYDARFQERVEPGLCGLNNLGNTCFMNSGLQCLSNTVPLAEFMVTGRCDEQVNRNNPLGTKGELLTEFADLLQDIWSGRMSAVAPRDFKWKLERFAPQFSGWQQHDSHELLAFLLDGLHEDLNRVTKKPYFETNEFEGLPEEEAAKKSWSQHIARNDSFITDWCHGQLRSEVNCNVCTRVSKVYDPFMYLSVPLPEAKTRAIECFVWDQNFKNLPLKYRIDAPKFGTIGDFVNEVARVSKLNPALMHVCDVYSQRFFKMFRRDEPLSSISDRDHIFVIEGGRGPAPLKDIPADDTGAVDIVVLWREFRQSQYIGYPSAPSAVDPPLIVSLPQSATYKDLYKLISDKLSRFFKNTSAAESAAVDSVDVEQPPVDQDLPLFKILMTDRYGQAATRPDFAPDEVVNLRHGDTVILLVHAPGLKPGTFDSKGAVDFQEHDSVKLEAAESESGITLSQCIELFGEKEQLSEEDPWYCSQCKEHRRAYKKFDLWQLPKILIIQLKRFSYRNKHWREKIESLVQFPLENLDLSKHIKGPVPAGVNQLYDLYAISNHYGALGGGHYTAFAKNINTGRWYKYDDSSVSEVSDPRQVVTPAAYILFYQRKDTLPAAGYHMPVPAKVLSQSQNAAAAPAAEEDEEEEPSGATVGSSQEGVGNRALLMSTESDLADDDDSSD